MDNVEMDEFVNRVREQSDIYAVVSRYVPLNLKSGRYWACCPFHSEKTASFSIIPEKGIFYCFGCHVGGNVFKFLSLIENITYYDAVKLQAERLNIPMPTNKKKSPEEIKRAQEYKNLLKVCEFAGEFYHDRLIKSPAGEVGRKYLAARGITSEIVKDFKLGIAPDSWDSLIDEMTKRGFQIDQLINAGLALRNKNGTSFYDRFRGRVIIPIHDVFGRTVAFGGRILVDDEQNPKYLNSPETSIFKKGQLLFGLDKAHQEISKTNTAIVVEGYMDAISLVSAGVKNVVASLGTAFTDKHAQLLSRYARRIIFCYDNDEAGQRATMRALPIVTDAGLEPFIITIPDGKDPDDFIRKHGKDAFDKLINKAPTATDYSLNYFIKNMSVKTIGDRLEILQKVIPIIAEFRDVAMNQHYRKKLSMDLMIDEDTILSKLNDYRKRKRQQNKVSPKLINLRTVTQAKKFPNAIEEAGCKILQTAWNEGDLLDYIKTLIPTETFSDVHKEIIDYIQRCADEDRTPNDLSAADELSDDANNEMIRILTSFNSRAYLEKGDVRAFTDAVNKLRLTDLKQKYNILMNEAKQCLLNDDDDNKYNQIIEQANEFKAKIIKLQNSFRQKQSE